MKERKDTVKLHKGDDPRVMIAAAGSGSGKTLITCALLEVLRRRELSLRAFKCGPDYIDPMFHARVLGVESSNLDSYFMDSRRIRHNIRKYPDRYTVIEGVMGIYDGTDVSGIQGSCYEIAEITDTPVILVVDASGVGRTVISQVKGILADDSHGLIKGIILNKISAGFFDKLRPVMEDELMQAGCADVRILGGIPKTDGVGVESRHLGLKLPSEIGDIREKIARFADVLEEKCDIDGILKIMEEAPDIDKNEDEEIPITGQSAAAGGTGADAAAAAGDTATGADSEDNAITRAAGPVIAVARDEAFCFYYEDNIEALIRAGARITYFSPIHDRILPEGTAGIILGGGYPELYLKELSGNTDMLASIKEAIDSGMPAIAECGGFMYLHSLVKDKEGRKYGLVGAIDGECSYAGHSVRFGYMQIEGGDGQDPKAFGASLAGIKGHEFHYYDSTSNGEDCTAVKPVTASRRKDSSVSAGESAGDRDRRRTWKCMMTGDDRLWGFPHLYYPSCTGLAEAFVSRASG